MYLNPFQKGELWLISRMDFPRNVNLFLIVDFSQNVPIGNYDIGGWWIAWWKKLWIAMHQSSDVEKQPGQGSI